MSTGPTHREKTLLAFTVYLDLLEAADRLHDWMRGPFQLFELTDRGLRLLVLLRRRGPLHMGLLAREFHCSPPNITQIVRPLERQGWIQREVSSLSPTPERASRTAKSKRGLPRRGTRVVLLRLTPLGEKFLAHVFPRQAKVVRALMRTLTSKEQQILSRICRKLTQGHILKFMSEIAHQDAWENDAEDAHLADEVEQVKHALSPLLQRRAESLDDAQEAGEEAPADAMLHALKPVDRERLAQIAQTLRNHDIVRYARSFYWDEPPDRDRDSEKAVQILMGIAGERERMVLERLARTMSAPEIIEFLEGMSEPVTTK